MFLEIWAQVPNWKGSDPMWIRKPEPPWTPPPRVAGQPRAKRPPPHDPEAIDWLAALNDLDLDSPALQQPVPDPPVPGPTRKKATVPEPTPAPPVARADLVVARAEALERVALMRAIAAGRRMDAVDPIFKLAFEADGVFRDECGRQIRSMESFAIPALIRLMHLQGPAALHLGKQRRYASYQLDRMDRARAAKAISSAPDDRVKAAIIHAYGEERALEAVEAILEQVDSPSHRVRKEARWAWLRYVTGRGPPPAPKRKRKLPGGKEEKDEKPDYLTYREIAILALQKQVATLALAPAEPMKSAQAMTERLFAYYDEKRSAGWDEQFHKGQAREQAGDFKGASDEYGWILAYEPNYARRGEMSHALVKYADELRGKELTSQALGYYRQAIDLDPAGTDARYARARVALLDGLESLERRHPDPQLFQEALALDPSLDEARRGLTKALTLLGGRRWLYAGEGAAAALVLFFFVWLLWRAVPRAVS
jgi:tetratricopeptide (TPR) repeat protein